jgi:death-on-curing protein
VTVWISEKLARAIHDEQIAQHGGIPGLRDPGLLESALARPPNAASDSDPGIVALGAITDLAIARSHPFLDGNKRTAFASMTTFFDLNGVMFDPPEAEAVLTMFALAADDVDDATFIAWVSRHAKAAP